MQSLRWSCVLMTVAGLGVWLSAQTQKPTFEVVSITRIDSALLSTIPTMRATPARSFLASATVEGFIRYAYSGTPKYKAVGAPEWIRTAQFRIDAQAAEAVSPEQMRLMVQSLLEDRFRLVIRKTDPANADSLVIDSVEQPTEK